MVAVQAKQGTTVFRHRVGIGAPAARVYEALTTTDGLAGWWARKVTGEPTVGGTLRFYFTTEEPSAGMEVVDLQPGRQIGWRCVQGPDEWVGTSVEINLT